MESASSDLQINRLKRRMPKLNLVEAGFDIEAQSGKGVPGWTFGRHLIVSRRESSSARSYKIPEYIRVPDALSCTVSPVPV